MTEPRPENPKVTAWYAASPSTFPSADPNQGEVPDYFAAAKLFSRIMRDEESGAAVALAAWDSVSGSGEPR